MVAIPETQDPTLAAVDRAIEARGNRAQARPYLGMSSIGAACDRALWYGFRWASPSKFDAASLKRFEDGHHGEDAMAARLRMVEGITLLTIDPDTGQQWEFVDFHGHFRGHFDGAILGLLQAPKTWHVWEHKVCNEKKIAKLEKLKQEVGEKNALRHWDAVYYAQAVLYMDYAGLDRHYLTADTPGGRHTVSVRTEASPSDAAALKARAEWLITADRTPPRISGDPAWFECKWCDHHATCHQGQLPQINCRTCLHVTPIDEGLWFCDHWGKGLNGEEQRIGCSDHLFLPSMVDGEQIDVADNDSWVEYRKPDGSIWRNEVEDLEDGMDFHDDIKGAL
jgi:hypothetical protein